MGSTSTFRVLELFCGIGGCAAALDKRAEVVAAIDIDCDALSVYRTNFPHPIATRTIESLPDLVYREADAELWWLSPPCQPYTVRGRRRDLEDSRAHSLKVVLQRIREIRPRYVALENVGGFEGSQAQQLVRETLLQCQYRIAERLLCPTEIGVPNRRPRYYLVAAQGELAPWPHWRVPSVPLREYLDPEPPQDLFVSPELVERYRRSMNIVSARDDTAITSCFTGAYGRSPVHSGSYLSVASGVRRFSPQEILRLLGFPESFTLPPKLSRQRTWSLAGNSLSVHAVRWVLSVIPELRVDGDDVAAGR